ncbi:MAG: serine hydrolase [Clostridia bacterium]|nr:serine hydrolase [Clostridia bacterium]
MSRVSAGSILRFLDRIERERVNLHGFELREGGKIRAEGYYAPFQKGQPHRMYSVSKSMVSLAIGMLEMDGKLSLDDRIVTHFPDKLPPQPDERLLHLTIRDMLRMATCHRKTTYREGIDEDWAATFFTVVPTHEPGAVFHYDTSCSQVLGALVERLSEQKLLDFLDTRLFAPIGADDPKRWLTDPSGVAQGGTGLMMSLRDMAKVAQLAMDGGRGLIPADYLASATAKQIETLMQGNPEERFGYGWQFWRTRDGWAMYGMGGQLAVAHPGSNLLLCTIADTRLDPYGVQRIYNAFFDEIIAHCGETSSDEDGQALANRLANLHVCGVLHDASHALLAQGTYQISDDNLQSVQLTQNSVRLNWTHAVHEFRWDTLGAVREDRFCGVPCLISAGMADCRTLHVQCRLIGDAPCGMDMLFSVENACMTAVLRRSSDPMTAGYDGAFWGKAL